MNSGVCVCLLKTVTKTSCIVCLFVLVLDQVSLSMFSFLMLSISDEFGSQLSLGDSSSCFLKFRAGISSTLKMKILRFSTF